MTIIRSRTLTRQYLIHSYQSSSFLCPPETIFDSGFSFALIHKKSPVHNMNGA